MLIPLLSLGFPGESTPAIPIGAFTLQGVQVGPLFIYFILGPAAEIYFVKILESYEDLTIFFTKCWNAVVLWLLIAVSIWFSVLIAKLSRLAAALPAPDVGS